MPKTESVAKKNRARSTLKLRQPIINEHKRTLRTSSANQIRTIRHRSCQPLRIEYYVTLWAGAQDLSPLSTPFGSLKPILRHMGFHSSPDQNTLLELMAEMPRLAKTSRTARVAKIVRNAKLSRLARSVKTARMAKTDTIAQLVDMAKEAEIARKARLVKLAKKDNLTSMTGVARMAKVAQKARMARFAKTARKTEVARLAWKLKMAKKERMAKKDRWARAAKVNRKLLLRPYWSKREGLHKSPEQPIWPKRQNDQNV